MISDVFFIIPPTADPPSRLRNIHPTDLATFLDQQHGVAIRSGHHCAQPLHRHLGDSASAPASPHLYNTVEDIDDFTRALNDGQLL
ncbi:hypothetical protein C1H46_028930 [Malus baccata]|uniref:Aminotransferase class V domain-containing protein n=1 Tax=Malus baccata TaxID=106549 RepID=A0A540LGB6_MALBA|nr:hypothetical protein C1H46_028930 [Malus baccata]